MPPYTTSLALANDRENNTSLIKRERRKRCRELPRYDNAGLIQHEKQADSFHQDILQIYPDQVVISPYGGHAEYRYPQLEKADPLLRWVNATGRAQTKPEFIKFKPPLLCQSNFYVF